MKWPKNMKTPIITVNEQLGKRIIYLRQKKGWSQLDLALESEINKNYICDLENGKRNPSLKILERLCVAFEIDLEVLFKGIDIINKNI